jgi:hypothetical protein
MSLENGGPLQGRRSARRSRSFSFCNGLRGPLLMVEWVESACSRVGTFAPGRLDHLVDATAVGVGLAPVWKSEVM